MASVPRHKYSGRPWRSARINNTKDVSSTIFDLGEPDDVVTVKALFGEHVKKQSDTWNASKCCQVPARPNSENAEDDSGPMPSSCTPTKTLAPPVLTEQEVVESLLRCRRFRNDYFEVRRSPTSGYGVFARKTLRPGDVILREKALLRAKFSTVAKRFEMLNEKTRRVIHSLHANTALRREMSFLETIWATNCFAIGGDEAGIFAISSRFNHRCDPSENVTFTFDNDTGCLILCVKDSGIEAGAELTISYGKGYSPERLYASFGFRCACGTCRGLTAREARSISKW